MERSAPSIGSEPPKEADRSGAPGIDYAGIVRGLRVPLLIFAGARVVYHNRAAERLIQWLRREYSTELVTVLRDHLAQSSSSIPRETLSLVRIPEGNHLLIDVTPTEEGYYAVGVRAPGLELPAIAAHYRLTPRELEVVQGVLRGLSNQTIADLLRVTTHTVKKHLTRAFDKVGVDSRTQLMSLIS
jgi:DNA-binding CsgD family transcriptional regulator